MGTHSSLIVLLHPETVDVKEEVARLLAPFYVYLDVEEHEEECECVAAQAVELAHSDAERLIGSPQEIYDRFIKEHGYLSDHTSRFHLLKRPMTEDENAELERLSERYNRLRGESDDSYTEVYRQAFKRYLLQIEPEPDCKNCNGTGKFLTTDNPMGRWENWCIGGRFSGFPTDMSDAPKKRSFFDCLLGERSSKEDYAGNVVKVSDLPAGHTIPFAVLSPQGHWHEVGELHDIQQMSIKEDYDAFLDWSIRYHQVFAENPDCLAVFCDLEI